MALIIQFLWISFIFLQGFLAITTLTLCKKKKATAPTPTTTTPQLDVEKTQDLTNEPAAVAADGGGGKGGGTKTKTGAPVAAKSAEKPKTQQKGAFDDTDLKSLPSNKHNPPPPPPEEVVPMSMVVQAGNDNKFISKGNGVFVDKDGNPISQLAQPPAKDDAPAG